MTKAKVDLARAKANLKAYVRKEISKRELVQFRIDQTTMERLLALAESRQQPLGTMVRDWVSERLIAEEFIEPAYGKSSASKNENLARAYQAMKLAISTIEPLIACSEETVPRVSESVRKRGKTKKGNIRQTRTNALATTVASCN